MKKLILGIILITLGALGLCALGGCVSVPRGPVFTWGVVSAGHWEQRTTPARCPGCPPIIVNVWCPAR